MRGSDLPPSVSNASLPEDAPEVGAASLENLFQQHQNELLGTVYYIVGNLQDAQDALQEAFLRCWKNLDQVPDVKNLKAWVFRITLNVGRDIRKTAWNRKRKEMPDEPGLLAVEHQTPDRLASENEQLLLLERRIAELDEPDREVFLLRQNGDFTYRQIAELLDIPEGTAKTRMRRALEKLREK